MFESIIFRNSTVTFRSTSLCKMQNRHTLTQFFSQPEMHVFPSFVFTPKCFSLIPAKRYWQKMTPLLKLFPSVRRKVLHLETTCFRFPCSESPPQENGQYRRGNVIWQDSPNATWRLSSPQAARRQFDKKLWGEKNAPKFDKRQPGPLILPQTSDTQRTCRCDQAQPASPLPIRQPMLALQNW